ncbi:acyl-CoA-binding domain-containing protein 3-like precursor [Vitis vinifera]|uniref:Acyl-CoA-binding protein n=1 Tax=Vitis vinifera TaxID=29760 RepID=E2IFU9_VITVI|nr:acyl-CoA-binding domain-containing protein 3-like precursor [Vitis vinifera]ADK56449.1 acyl-CoA-binding protein [Vitis vinifera]|eukprot:NP_001268019.1 acyl-CoA-binding domain-containing protein 3-like precursor [Vitis vinifera]
MELAQELLFTVSLALLFSFLVAKLVSLAMAADLKSAQNVDDHIVANEVRFVETETRVESVDGGSGLVEETCEITRGGEVPVMPSEEEVSEIVELPENSPRERSGHEILVSHDVAVVEERDERELESEEDDWEGVERSELERVFAAAANFVGSGNKGDGWSSDAQMELYGLHKIAVEGPCHEPQPMPLKLSARAKWNAWQRMGNMSREVAMEQYIALLSDRVPGWMEASSAGDDKPESSEGGVHDILDPNQSSLLHDQISSTNETKPELKSGTLGIDLTEGSNSVSTEKE